jgi:hypothetical protein
MAPKRLFDEKMGNSRQLQAILERARRQFRAGKGIPSDQFWKELETERRAKKEP